MGRRAMWSGAITFGMVNIPVKLFSATSAKDISFNLLHSTCGTRLQQKRWCPTEDVEVPWEEVVRGYEYTKGEYVIVKDCGANWCVISHIGKDCYVSRGLIFNPYYGSKHWYQFAPKHPQPGRS